MPSPTKSPGAAWGQGLPAGAIRAVGTDRIVGKATPPSFEAIAGALRRQAGDLVLAAEGVEHDGFRLQITPVDVARRVSELRAEAVLIGEAYRIIAALAPLEFSVRAMIKAA